MGKGSGGARSRARKLAMQALYQRDLAGHSVAEVSRQFADDGRLDNADAKFFKAILGGVETGSAQLDAILNEASDRPLEQLDPVERAILRMAVWELSHCAEIPFRAVIDEAVSLARRFGAQDGHRFVNAVLDRIARRERSGEFTARGN